MKFFDGKTRAFCLALLCFVALGSAAAVARKQFSISESGKPNVHVSLTGIVVRNKENIPVEKASLVKPGEVLDWTIISQNDGTAPAQQYKAIGMIPNGTELVKGSVNADRSASVLYSIDNGKSYSAQPMVPEKQADGSIKQVAAPVAMYTHLQYEWTDPLMQGSKLVASYKVRVK
jgi:uncharacterized repeat protein (TIGR01451 family)